MKILTVELPAMYGDHHVMAVRDLLFAIPGVEDVYASSSFQVVEVKYDDSQTDEGQIKSTLEEAGYLGALEFEVEVGASVEEGDPKPYFRTTAVYEQTKKTVSFSQKTSYQGRPLWHCPGIGTVKTEMED